LDDFPVTDHEKIRDLFRRARSFYTREELAGLLNHEPPRVAGWESGETPLPYRVYSALDGLVASPVTRKGPGVGGFEFIDLFAGIGGIRLGFESAGGRCVFTSEWDAFARRTYDANFGGGHDIAGDITGVDASEVPDHDVLLAGFPCQPFSLAGVSKKNSLGRPHGFSCATQGTLFFDVARIIERKRPRAFLLENVKNLLSHDGGRTFRVIRETLERELGYHVHFRVLDGRHFVPQHRERILIVGFSEKTAFDWDAIPLGRGPREAPRVRDILHREDGAEDDPDGGRFLDDGGGVREKYVLSDKLWKYLRDYAAKHKARGNGFGFGMVDGGKVARTLSARYYKDGAEILVDRGGDRNPRRLTPRECARLMGFPDTFRIVVSDNRAYKQFGNSVVVPLMAHVAALMSPWLGRSAREVPTLPEPAFAGTSPLAVPVPAG
jgi:DNA (cytosine-5)-methyltransferase 1